MFYPNPLSTVTFYILLFFHSMQRHMNMNSHKFILNEEQRTVEHSKHRSSTHTIHLKQKNEQNRLNIFPLYAVGRRIWIND